ncbi:T9SS type A sorting domain-containing protein [Brumimicrobium mesophilum]|uniref:T9SS type A sorting domain-containing protein n=1 Tax=Brumimicrobium mesophilum TaxID=392717 RepID=UPI00131ADF49|nr:T9SS type A sorting domain-containing protein [Brumimicrobium mesophilum]
MRTQFTFLLFALFATFSYAQTTYNLEIVAEGNFGTTNGDVFNVSNSTGTTTISSGVYQAANNSTGFDILQDFQVFGDVAMIVEKPAFSGRIVIVDYPSLTEVHTFTTSDAPQTISLVSETKGYVSTGNPATIQFVDIANNTITPVTDANNDISSYSLNMVHANGIVYAAMGSKVVMVDTLTQAVSGVINPGIGSINGLVYDELTDMLWAMNGTGSLISIDILNSNSLGTEILTGVSSSALLRIYDSKLYFWNLSSQSLFIYNSATPSTLPLTSSYTSTMSGNAWSFGYGRSFDVDQNTGDFAITSADGFMIPSLFEVVDGATFALIDSGSATGVAIANRLRLETFPAGGTIPIPDVATLPMINEECEATLTAPTADGGTVVATTTDPITYSTQGMFTVTWTYTNANGTETQTQDVVIEDVTAPTPDVMNLAVIDISCDSSISSIPMATDNCEGAITATTVDPLTYSTAGTYTINWVYADAAGNETIQTQTVEVTCSNVGLNDYAVSKISIYPNPTTDVLNIATDEVNFEGILMNTQGQTVLKFNNEKMIHVGDLPIGVYYLQLSGALGILTKKVVLR